MDCVLTVGMLYSAERYVEMRVNLTDIKGQYIGSYRFSWNVKPFQTLLIKSGVTVKWLITFSNYHLVHQFYLQFKWSAWIEIFCSVTMLNWCLAALFFANYLNIFCPLSN